MSVWSKFLAAPETRVFPGFLSGGGSICPPPPLEFADNAISHVNQL